MIIERWEYIKDFEGLYIVSDLGRVKNARTERIRKPYPNRKNGYLKIALHKNGKRRTFKVHRLVAIAFIPNPMNLPEVNHTGLDSKGNANKQDNRACSLEWSTVKNNRIRGVQHYRHISSVQHGQQVYAELSA